MTVTGLQLSERLTLKGWLPMWSGQENDCGELWSRVGRVQAEGEGGLGSL